MLSVPKTGTHSYIDHLHSHADITIRHPQNLKHMSLEVFTKRFLPLFPEPHAELDYFGYVRNPVDWLWSWYRYRSRPGIRSRITYTGDITFSDFIKGYLDTSPPVYARVGRQSAMIKSKKPPYLANMIFKYENQDEANRYLSDKLGLHVNPEKVLNKSPEIEASISRDDILILEREIPQEFELYESAK